MSMAKSEFVERIIEVLKTGGWVQKAFNNPDGCCILGACISVRIELEKTVAETELMRNAFVFDLTEEIKNTGFTTDANWVLAWNDTPGRTKEEVIAMLEKLKTKYLEQEKT
jgi:hypothetical protein